MKRRQTSGRNGVMQRLLPPEEIAQVNRASNTTTSRTTEYRITSEGRHHSSSGFMSISEVQPSTFLVPETLSNDLDFPGVNDLDDLTSMQEDPEPTISKKRRPVST